MTYCVDRVYSRCLPIEEIAAIRAGDPAVAADGALETDQHRGRGAGHATLTNLHLPAARQSIRRQVCRGRTFGIEETGGPRKIEPGAHPHPDGGRLRRRGGRDSNPRYRITPVQGISNPPHSTNYATSPEVLIVFSLAMRRSR